MNKNLLIANQTIEATEHNTNTIKTLEFPQSIIPNAKGETISSDMNEILADTKKQKSNNYY